MRILIANANTTWAIAEACAAVRPDNGRLIEVSGARVE
jgi:hypothetical protein